MQVKNITVAEPVVLLELTEKELNTLFIAYAKSVDDKLLEGADDYKLDIIPVDKRHGVFLKFEKLVGEVRQHVSNKK